MPCTDLTLHPENLAETPGPALPALSAVRWTLGVLRSAGAYLFCRPPHFPFFRRLIPLKKRLRRGRHGKAEPSSGRRPTRRARAR